MNDKILYFLAAAETLNFSRAGKRFFVSATAISKAVSGLEAEMNVELFQRHHNSLTLTTAGRRFYNEAQALVSDYKRIISNVQHTDELQQQQLTIGFSSIYEAILLSKIANVFRVEHPNFSLLLVHRSLEQLEQNVSDGLIDIAYSFGKDQSSLPNVIIRTIYSGDYVLGVSSLSSLTQLSCVSPANIENLTCGFYSQFNSNFAQRRLQEEASEDGFNISHIRQYETYERFLVGVATNECFGLFPKVFSGNFFDEIQCVDSTLGINRYHVVQIEQKNSTDALKKFKSFVKQYLAHNPKLAF